MLKPREKKMIFLIKKFGITKGGEILDVGCGDGFF